MKQFILGAVVGASLMASLGLAGNLYDRSGNPAAPRGSVESFDYFRQRQQQLDVQNIRKQQLEDSRRHAGRPCP